MITGLIIYLLGILGIDFLVRVINGDIGEGIIYTLKRENLEKMENIKKIKEIMIVTIIIVISWMTVLILMSVVIVFYLTFYFKVKEWVSQNTFIIHEKCSSNKLCELEKDYKEYMKELCNENNTMLFQSLFNIKCTTCLNDKIVINLGEFTINKA